VSGWSTAQAARRRPARWSLVRDKLIASSTTAGKRFRPAKLIGLEHDGWEALSSSGEAAQTFYERVLDRTVVMLLRGGLVLDERVAIVASMSGRPWYSFELQNIREPGRV
jgi:hypothetical protein